MSENLPGITVLIPTKPDQTEIKAVTAARAFDYPADKLEILVARGKQPSVQRNIGLKEARGEIIYFLDDDSVAPPDNLRRAIEHFRDPKVKMVGGPNLCPPDAPFLEQVFALVLSSWLGFFSSRARYAQVGAVRETSEKELILCNLLAQRDTMLELGGFNEALYPNEENALMDEMRKRGYKLIYDPQLFVHRRPRSSLKAFCRMLQTYGRGRAEQFREHPTLGSAPNFVPPMFLVYLLTLLLVCSIDFVPRVRWFQDAYGVPLSLYEILVLSQVIVLMPRGGIVRSLCALPLIVLTHLLYGYGFWRGLFTKLDAKATRAVTAVTIERMKK